MSWNGISQVPAAFTASLSISAAKQWRSNPKRSHPQHRNGTSSFSILSRSRSEAVPKRSARKNDLLGPQKPVEVVLSSILADKSLDPTDAKLFQSMTPLRAELFARVLRNRTRHFTFVLDGVHGAHNLAAIARSCDAYGVQDLHIVPGSHDYSNAKGDPDASPRNISVIERFETETSVKQVSKGSHKWLTISEYDSVKDCLDVLRQSGYRIIVSSVSPSAKPLKSIDITTKCAFVFGNERFGVTKLTERQADELFTIPMLGFVESMNVSVAVATTACLIVDRAQSMVSRTDYLLSPEERRSLAHSWLTRRHRRSGPQKQLPTKREMTKLGVRIERAIVSQGLFPTIDENGLSESQYWEQKLRLDGYTGGRLATYLTKRKFGALGDKKYTKRCETISDCLSGTHALSCEVVRSTPSLSTTRKGILQYFKRLCRLINDDYGQHFDAHGMPLLPLFAPESDMKLEEVKRSISQISYAVCVELAQEEFGMSERDVRDVVQRTTYRDIATCILDTIKCKDKEKRSKFMELINEGFCSMAEVRSIVRDRHPKRKILLESTMLQGLNKQIHDEFSPVQRDALQIFLRMSHAAFLCSEIHQAVWNREAKCDYLLSIHSPRFCLLESVLCEAYSEMSMLLLSPYLAFLRLVFEWDQALVPLKNVSLTAFGDRVLSLS
ncbi:tRNA (guanosine(18)-2'-O)-methyltransferase [Gracilariopsis chorda]|uniref:tRNA (Guanosine(18)-2'-O)-methyltransferase n=1 Tax=Gracilariopsis chorda TaxID=448386 RepID=A0A2V3IK77_9FLOR|nr:tRNA (guanosine(18)-2'-O)-methyltransferase [Gracilariopsis chorda]|eukprot:PXF42495.1 tRNA (guanosine(18)-2'-O)-methyltransferase [Gracilariopsis chorda]